jgi:hypothetical protein
MPNSMLCPVCKADNAQGSFCRRCKADLSLLFRLESQRRHLLASAWRCLGIGQWAEAARAARRADGLRTDDDSRRMLAITALFSRNFEEAHQYYTTGAAGR